MLNFGLGFATCFAFFLALGAIRFSFEVKKTDGKMPKFTAKKDDL